MKRTELKRKTPLVSKTRLAPGKQPLRRTRIAPRSQKRISEDAKRRLLKARLLEERPICERCHRQRSHDPHERQRRSQGGSPLDELIISMICRGCHDWIHEHPLLAHAEGWLVRRGDVSA